MHDLFKIVQFGQSIMLNDYLAKNPSVDVNMKDADGDYLLHFTTVRENEEEVRTMTEQLLRVGANPNVVSSSGNTPLIHLLTNNNLSGLGASPLTRLFIEKVLMFISALKWEPLL